MQVEHPASGAKLDLLLTPGGGVCVLVIQLHEVCPFSFKIVRKIFYNCNEIDCNERNGSKRAKRIYKIDCNELNGTDRIE
jgi:hypothetical protein